MGKYLHIDYGRKLSNTSPEGKNGSMGPCNMTKKDRGWSWIGIYL